MILSNKTAELIHSIEVDILGRRDKLVRMFLRLYREIYVWYYIRNAKDILVKNYVA